ncbi:MAG: DUF2249 domain-containing protein [Verrucomicrobia bacterium]|nr:DUF2249 domain-containing protein [Verrucomicrobiota bacterium]
MNAASHILDVREIPCSDKHRQIFQRWNETAPGDFFILWNRSNPIPLLRYFETALAGSFTWEYLENEPESCRIKISKLQATAAVTDFPTCRGH